MISFDLTETLKQEGRRLMDRAENRYADINNVSVV